MIAPQLRSFLPWKHLNRVVEMLTSFLRFIETEKLCRTGDRICLAVSGGADSVVMTDLFVLAGYRGVIAHVNHNLRGTESDQDEEFTAALAQRYGWEFVSRTLASQELS